jgi:hypothetical protein
VPSTFSEVTARPSFFSVPAKAPRTVCGCQLVASTIWAMVAPSLRRSIAISCACFVPSRVLRRAPVRAVCGLCVAPASSAAAVAFSTVCPAVALLPEPLRMA